MQFSRKTVLITIATVFALAVAGFWATAKAADKGGPKVSAIDQALAPATIGSSCYAGGSVGAFMGVMDPIFGLDGYQYGLKLGCDARLGRLLVGGFVDHDWKHTTVFSTGIDAREWSYGVRAGVLATDNTLLYGLVSRPRLTVQGMNTNGIGIGGGIETMIAKGWSTNLEYRRETFDDIANAREHSVRFGINYHFPVPLGR